MSRYSCSYAYTRRFARKLRILTDVYDALLVHGHGHGRVEASRLGAAVPSPLRAVARESADVTPLDQPNAMIARIRHDEVPPGRDRQPVQLVELRHIDRSVLEAFLPRASRNIQ